MNDKSIDKDVEGIKYKIKQILWEEDFVRKLNIDITENLISPPYSNEYLGREGHTLEPKYLNAITKMFSAMLLNFFMDKVIDAVIDAQEVLREREIKT